MPKHGNRSNRVRANYVCGRVAAKRVGVLALSSLWLAAGSAYAVTPLNTYFGPGLPLDNYFPEGVPGTADQEDVTVRSRLRTDYNAQGIREGAFIIKPSVDAQVGYNSNVVGGAQYGQGSSLLQTSASVSVNTDYSRNNLGLTAGVNDSRYWEVPRMSHTDYNVSFGGGWDLGRDQLDASVSFQSANEEPYDIGAEVANNAPTTTNNEIQLYKPLNYTDTDFRTSYTTTLGRFTLTPNADYQLLRFAHGDFTNVPIGSESSFNETLRDSNILQGGVIGRYEFLPGRSALVVINGNYNTYSHGQNTSIGVVNSTGLTFLTGLDYVLSGATTFRALGGYQERFFSSRNGGNQGAPIGEADVIWNPTGLTTITARYARTIEDATTDSVTGYTYDRLSLIADHELYRNILLQISGHYDKATYADSNLRQTQYGVGAGVTYLINRNLQAALSYQFVEHEGSGGDNNYNGGSYGNTFGQHVVTLNVRFGL